MSEHTKEPWQASPPEDIYGNWVILCSGPHDVAHLANRYKDGIRNTEMDAANARRIVACVNACAGIHDDMVAHVVAFGLQGHNAVSQQRDTLNAALVTTSEGNAKLMEQRDELLTICKSVVERGIGASDIRAMESAIAKMEASK